MGFNFNGTQANVTLSGSIQTWALPTGAAEIRKENIRAGNGVATIHTVTAAKTLYLSSIWLSGGNSAAASNDDYVYIEAETGAGTGTYTQLLSANVKSNSNVAGMVNLVSNPTIYPVIPAGAIIRVRVDGGAVMRGGINGFEV